MAEDTEELFLAVNNNDILAVESLISRGVDLNSSKGGNTALHQAVYQHDQGSDGTELIKYLLSQGIDADQGNYRGNTALHIIARKNYPDILKILLEHQVDKDKLNKNGESALHIAANLNKLENVKVLLEFGAKTTGEDIDGFTPLLRAINNKGKCQEVTEYMIEYGGNINKQIGIGESTSLLLKDSKIFESLIRKGLDINTFLVSKETYLTTVLKLEYLDIAELLIKNGANLTIQNKKDETPLKIALENKMYGMVILLLEYGAQFEFKDDNFLSMVFDVEESLQDDLMDVLLKRANLENFKIADRVSLIYESIAKMNFTMLSKLITKFRILWTGRNQIDNVHQNHRIKFQNEEGKVMVTNLHDYVDADVADCKSNGLRDLRTTKKKVLDALLKAIEKEKFEFLDYIFQALPIKDQVIFFSQENGIHHIVEKGKTLIQALAEKGNLIFLRFQTEKQILCCSR